MTKIDFLSTQDTDSEARLRLACRVAQRAVREGQSVYVACENADQVSVLDRLLWSFEPESFVAHSTEINKPHAPVTLGHGNDCGDQHSILINLCSPAPAFFSQFERLFEVVVQLPEVLAQTRANWSYYKSRGYPLDFRNI